MYTRHANLNNQCLRNVAFSMTKALNNRSSHWQNFHSLLPTNAILKTLRLLMLVFLFFTLLFLLQISTNVSTDNKILTDLTPVGISWLVGKSNIMDSKLVGINQMKLLT